MMKKFRKEKKPKEEKFEDGEQRPIKTKKRTSIFWIFSKKNRNKKKNASEGLVTKPLEACNHCGRLNEQSLPMSTADGADRLPVKVPIPMYSSQPLLERVEPVPGSESQGSLSADGSLSSGFHEVNLTGNGRPRFRERAGTRTERRLSLPLSLNRNVDDDVTDDNSRQHPSVPVSMAMVRCRRDDSADERRIDVGSRDSYACAERRVGDRELREEEEKEEEKNETTADVSNVGQLWIGGQELPATFSDGTTMTVKWSLEGNRIVGSISDGRMTKKEVNTQTEIQLFPEPISSVTPYSSVDVSAVCFPGDAKDSDNSTNKEQPSKKEEQDFDDKQTQAENFEEIFDDSGIKMKSFTDDNSGIVVDLKEEEFLQKIISVESTSEMEDAPKDRIHLVSKENAKTNDVIDLTIQLSVVSPSSEICPDFDGHTASGPGRFRSDVRDGDLDVESNLPSSISRVSDEVSSSRSKIRHWEPIRSTKEVTSSRGFADVIWIDASDSDNRTASGKAFGGTGNGSPSHIPLRQSLSVASTDALLRQRLEHRSSNAGPEVVSSGKKPGVTSPKATPAGSRHLCSGASWKSVSDLSRFGSTTNVSWGPSTPPSPPSVSDPEYAALLAEKFRVLSSRFRTLAADADARKSRQMSKVMWDGAGKQNADNRLTFFDGGNSKIEATEAQKYPSAKATEEQKYRSVRDLRFQLADDDSTSFRSSCASSSVFGDGMTTTNATPDVVDVLQLANASLNRPGKKTLQQQLSDIRQHLDQWHRDLTLSNRLLRNNSMSASIDCKR